MASTAMIIFDRIAAQLNAQAFSLPAVAETKIIPEYKLVEDVASFVRVPIVPWAHGYERAARHVTNIAPRASLQVMKKIGDDDDSEAQGRALVDLCEEIILYLMWNPILSESGDPIAILSKVENTAAFAGDKMRDERMFHAVFILTFDANIVRPDQEA